jgi:hypothetical protein
MALLPTSAVPEPVVNKSVTVVWVLDPTGKVPKMLVDCGFSRFGVTATVPHQEEAHQVCAIVAPSTMQETPCVASVVVSCIVSDTTLAARASQSPDVYHEELVIGVEGPLNLFKAAKMAAPSPQAGSDLDSGAKLVSPCAPVPLPHSLIQPQPYSHCPCLLHPCTAFKYSLAVTPMSEQLIATGVPYAAMPCNVDAPAAAATGAQDEAVDIAPRPAAGAPSCLETALMVRNPNHAMVLACKRLPLAAHSAAPASLHLQLQGGGPDDPSLECVHTDDCQRIGADGEFHDRSLEVPALAGLERLDQETTTMLLALVAASPAQVEDHEQKSLAAYYDGLTPAHLAHLKALLAAKGLELHQLGQLVEKDFSDPVSGAIFGVFKSRTLAGLDTLAVIAEVAGTQKFVKLLMGNAELLEDARHIVMQAPNGTVCVFQTHWLVRMTRIF